MRLPIYRFETIPSVDRHPSSFAIAEYVEYGPGTPYNSITLYTAIENNNGAPSHDGDLTVVIIYRTVCTTLEENHIVISFGIGNNVTVNAIIGLPVLKAFEVLVDLQYNTLN